MTDALEKIAPYEGPKGEELYRHNAEGRDDMPVRGLRDQAPTIFGVPD